MAEKNERAYAIREAISRAASPAPLAEQDQDVVVYEELEPQWVDVPFKRPLGMLWDWGALLQSATARIKDQRLAIIGLVMSWASARRVARSSRVSWIAGESVRPLMMRWKPKQLATGRTHSHSLSVSLTVLTKYHADYASILSIRR